MEINGENVGKTNTTEYVGLMTDDKLTWTKHARIIWQKL